MFLNTINVWDFFQARLVIIAVSNDFKFWLVWKFTFLVNPGEKEFQISFQFSFLSFHLYFVLYSVFVLQLVIHIKHVELIYDWSELSMPKVLVSNGIGKQHSLRDMHKMYFCLTDIYKRHVPGYNLEDCRGNYIYFLGCLQMSIKWWWCILRTMLTWNLLPQPPAFRARGLNNTSMW